MPVDTLASTSPATPGPGPLPTGLPLARASASATVRTTTGTTVGTISPITCFDTRGPMASLTAAGLTGVQHLTPRLSSPGLTPKTASVLASAPPTFSPPAHGWLVPAGTLSVKGQSRSFTKTVRF